MKYSGSKVTPQKGPQLQQIGSLTVEALLILPMAILGLTLLIKVGQVIYGDLQQESQTRVEQGRPVQRANLIRRTDLLLDWGRGIKEVLPRWF